VVSASQRFGGMENYWLMGDRSIRKAIEVINAKILLTIKVGFALGIARFEVLLGIWQRSATIETLTQTAATFSRNWNGHHQVPAVRRQNAHCLV
jgi:hypothetical protein